MPPLTHACFEDMKGDLRGSIKRVADFLAIECDEALLDAVESRSSFAYMSSPEHMHHFDDHFVQGKVRPKMGLPMDVPFAASKVRKDGGKVGGRSAIPAAVRERLDRRWEDQLAEGTGCASYAELRAKVNGVQ